MTAQADQIGQCQLVIAQGTTSVLLAPETESVFPGGILYRDITVVGENGEWEANVGELLRITLTDGELLSFGCTTPCTEERYQSRNVRC